MYGGFKRPNAPLGWGIVASVCVALLAFLIWSSESRRAPYVLGSASAGAEQACGYEQARQAASEAADAYDNARQSGVGVSRRRIEADTAERRAQNAHECEERARDRADLDAQWRSAYAAENTYDITQKLRWLAIAELALLIMAVAAAWKAIFDSSAHAERDLIERSRPEFEIILTDMNLGNIGKDDVPRTHAYAGFRAKNIGGRPAIVTYSASEFFVGEHPPIPAKALPLPIDAVHKVVSPGDYIPVPAGNYSTWSEAEEAEIIAREKVVFVVGYVEYTDRLGIEWECGFVYYLWIFGTSIRGEDGKRQGIAGKLTPWASRTHNFDRRRKPKPA